MNPDELVLYLEALTARAALAATPVVNAMADRYHWVVSREELTRYWHSVGTRTPSPPGEPPAWMTGRLSQSITKQVTPGSPEARASVAPHTIYAHIQEVGGPIWANIRLGAKGKKLHTLSFVTNGVRYFPLEVRLPPRPYMRPASEEVVRDGSLRRAALDAFETWMGW